MVAKKSNLSLIGMPGAGKSTIGMLLAKKAGLGFLDTDLLIQQAEDCTLQELVDARGHIELRKIEECCLLKIDCVQHVISTGGSVVYSEPVMKHLSSLGPIVFLDVDFEQLVQRVGDFSNRGLAAPKGQGFKELFNERQPLYLKYCDIRIDCDGLSPDACSDEILERLED